MLCVMIHVQLVRRRISTASGTVVNRQRCQVRDDHHSSRPTPERRPNICVVTQLVPADYGRFLSHPPCASAADALPLRHAARSLRPPSPVRVAARMINLPARRARHPDWTQRTPRRARWVLGLGQPVTTTQTAMVLAALLAGGGPDRTMPAHAAQGCRSAGAGIKESLCRLSA
jgi:hypothetical protein